MQRETLAGIMLVGNKRMALGGFGEFPNVKERCL
jgi:hypothetical protein